VTIRWDQAVAEFMRREPPKWEAECRAAPLNYDLLPGDCAGAMISLHLKSRAQRQSWCEHASPKIAQTGVSRRGVRSR
jgi:hypothetical protein